MNHSKPRLYGLCVLMLGLTFAGGARGQDGPTEPLSPADRRTFWIRMHTWLDKSQWAYDAKTNEWTQVYYSSPEEGGATQVTTYLDKESKIKFAVKTTTGIAVYDSVEDAKTALGPKADFFFATQARPQLPAGAAPTARAQTYQEAIATWPKTQVAGQPASVLEVGRIGTGTFTNPTARVTYFPNRGNNRFEVDVGGQKQSVPTYGQARELLVERIARNPDYKASLPSVLERTNAAFPPLASQTEEAKIAQEIQTLKDQYEATAVELKYNPAAKDKIEERQDSNMTAQLAAEEKLKLARQVIDRVQSCRWKDAPSRLFVATCSQQIVCAGDAECRVNVREKGGRGDELGVADVSVRVGCTVRNGGADCLGATECLAQEGVLVAGDRLVDYDGKRQTGDQASPDVSAEADARREKIRTKQRTAE